MKIIYKYGVMNSGKTLDLVGRVHSLREKGNTVYVLKSERDTRSKETKSRSGMNVNTDFTIPVDTRLVHELVGVLLDLETDFVFIDEGQFLEPEVIDTLVNGFKNTDVVLIVYGLLKDYKGKLFDGTERWVELATKFIEIETQCEYPGCTSKATFNIMYDENHNRVTEGDTYHVGDTEFAGVCLKHFL